MAAAQSVYGGCRLCRDRVFEHTIEQLVALAVLMPIVASMGGNAGTQTLTVAVRALALRQLSRQTVGRFIFRELAVGAVNGMVFALTAGVISWLWFGNIDIAIIMGFAMIANLIIAGLSGTLIPLRWNAWALTLRFHHLCLSPR